MLLTCPECQVDCTIDEKSADTANCPSCGLLLYSRSGLQGRPAVSVKADRELTESELEETRQWQASLDDLLPSPELLPRRLGRYEVTQLLGEGSFAQVYLAFDSQLERDVALKLPKRNRFSSAESMSQFLNEATRSARLEHPGIVRVYDIGWLSNDVCFISMEYCSGGSLDHLLKSEKISVVRVAEILADVAEASHYAHLNGLVHRDLKPSNLMFGKDGRPRIVDFGLALPEEEQFQHAGELAGTLPYMSPEQVRGEAHRLEGRSDIWSLGVILYQLLTGRRPFVGDKSRIVDEILHREPKPPRQIDDQIPRELEQICLRCLSKNVSARYSTALDLCADLRAAVRSISESSVVPVVQQNSADKPRTRRYQTWAATGMLVIALVSLAAAGGLFGFAIKRDPPQLEPTLPWKLSDDLPVLRPFELLERSPKEFIWADNPQTSNSYSSTRRDFTIDSPHYSLISLGETDAVEFNLEVEFVRSALTGEAGLFFGLRPTANKNEWRVNTVYFQGVGVGAGEESGPDKAFRVTLDEVTLSTEEPPGMRKRSYLATQFVNFSVGQPHHLSLKFMSGRFVRASWNHVELPNFTVDVPPRRQLLANGGFGIYNEFGSSRFRDARFTLLKKGKQRG